jgi:phospholipase A2
MSYYHQYNYYIFLGQGIFLLAISILFQELLLAEQWAKLNKLPFLPVSKQVAEFEKEPIKELYIFMDDTDEYCPVILHFVIINKTFKEYKAPGKLEN